MFESLVWWAWPLIMFGFTFIIGLIAPVSGVGGGVLFVPLSTAFFPFSLDFIRGTGLIMGLTGALSSSPRLTRAGMANLRIMVPIVIVSILTSVPGGTVGLWVTNTYPAGQHIITTALGVLLFIIFYVMLRSDRVEFPKVLMQGPLAKGLGLEGAWYESSMACVIEYKATRLRWGLLAFAAVGFVAGMFGLGAGWASVPVLNLIMGCPIKVATSTTMLIISANSAAASWVYLANGAVLPLLVLPSVLGMTLGARIGTRLAMKAKPRVVRYLVMGIMLFSAILDIVKGLGGLGIIPKII